MCIFNLLVYFLDMVFELQNRLMKKLLFKKMIYLFLILFKFIFFNKKSTYCNEIFKVNRCNMWNLLQ